MKKIFIIASLVSFMLLSTQCKKTAIEKPVYAAQSSKNFYRTDADISSALTGTYLELRQTWNEFSLEHYLIEDVSTDDALKGGGSDDDRGDFQSLSNFIVYPTNSEVNNTWSILYNLINRTNEVIVYAPAAEGDKALIDRYINEAKLLRAFGYYNLVTLYGGVPLVLKPLISAEAVSTPRATVEEVYAQIVSDLTAATALPKKSEYGAADQYRVSQGLAYTLLGKTYMFRGDFAKAITAFQTVVTSGVYSLLTNYGDNWKINNSSESVFEISDQMGSDKNIALGSNVPHFFTSRGTSENYQGYGFHIPTTDLFNEFSPDDPRITYTFTMTGDRYLQDIQDQDNSSSATGFGDRKIEVPYYKRIGLDPWMISYNIRLIRYSDVLLLYSEALNETGNPGLALTYLNQVRSRARRSDPKDSDKEKQVYIPNTNPNTSLPDVTTTDLTALRLAIWHERRCELGMEGWRRDDLSRQKRFGQTMKAYATKYKTTKGANFNDSRDYLLPIPQNEIDYSNKVISQNPGY